MIIHHNRRAFTLVEMLVSTALIMMMMYIISAAFEKGIAAFSSMKTAGDMQDRLRSAGVILRQDLTRNHFDNSMLVSDQRLDQPYWRMPNEPSDGGGYFRVYQADESLEKTTVEGTDPDNGSLVVTRSKGTKHVLQFTIRLRPDEYRRDLFFSASTGVVNLDGGKSRLSSHSVPDYMRPGTTGLGGELSTTFTSRWAEVSYFLQAIPREATTSTAANPNGLQLYGLYRRQKLLVEPLGGRTPTLGSVPAEKIADISTWGNSVNGPKEITVPGRRFGMMPSGSNWYAGLYGPDGIGLNPTINTYAMESGTNSSTAGGDLLLSDVLSFEIKALWDVPTDTKKFRVATGPLPGMNVAYPPQRQRNADFPFDYLPLGMNGVLRNVRVFDTWTQENLDKSYAFSDGTARPPWNSGHFITDNNSPSERTIPLRVRLRAVQIKLRIYDKKSSQTRQMTIVQDV